MKRVVIGISDCGLPYVISKSRNIEVVIKQPKKRTFKKTLRIWIFQIKKFLRLI